MTPAESKLYRFLCKIGNSALAERYKRVVSTTPIQKADFDSVAKDVLMLLYRKLLSLKRPDEMSIMTWDEGHIRAQKWLQKPETVSSRESWASAINKNYITFYEKVKG